MPTNKIIDYTEAAHSLIDQLYDCMFEHLSLKRCNPIAKEERQYGISVKGDYARVEFEIFNKWVDWGIVYVPALDSIEIRSGKVLLQKKLEVGVKDYWKITHLLDDLISLIERWRDSKQNTTRD